MHDPYMIFEKPKSATVRFLERLPHALNLKNLNAQQLDFQQRGRSAQNLKNLNAWQVRFSEDKVQKTCS